MKILAVASHPDDIELGCWATLKKLEPEVSCIERFVYGQGRGTPSDQKFDRIALKDVIQEIETRIYSIKPDVVFTHYAYDLNRDHRIISEATMAACRPVPGCPVKEIYQYEVPSSTEWSEKTFTPNTWVEVTDFIDKKVNVLLAFYTEMRPPPHPRSYDGVRALSVYRGQQVGVLHAEAFICVRRIWT